MTALKNIADKVRSKNAGPFWLTLDVFCGTVEAFARISSGLDTGLVADMFKADPATLKRFDMPELNVVKFSMPRPAVQGTHADRDMHGASFAVLLGEIEIR
ncbi:DUF4387 family protein [Aliiroseovarius sp. F47248L]|uniref:DUF4387 family protein n=1 Tax=Aliiroseovarius sp. F47248L TaxID=2926420 RepID=UPI001FF141F7|nr:DUF4387 family protein [Aliiroseovarius sp. F47248L]MCK0139980.1 DUF4387 domain-containing protein [Aliiroseovarius sp. F47248L]